MGSILELQEWIRATVDARYGFQADATGARPSSRLVIQPYAYTTPPVSLAAGLTNTQLLQIQANADFICTRIFVVANVAGAAQSVSNQPNPLLRIQVTDTGSAQPFFNNPVSAQQFAANGNFNPNHFLTYPRWLTANTALSIQTTSYEAAATDVFELLLDGVRVYELSPGQRG